jgi:hypothetical protein
MPRRLFEILSCIIATALILGHRICTSSRQIVATVKNAFEAEWARQLRC